MAPHGGNIEPHTSEIARLIAGDRFNLFCFNGKREKNNRKLHITSHHYDEDTALLMATSSTLVLTIHGCTTREPMIFIGGLHDRLKLLLAEEFRLAGLPAILCEESSPLSGRNPNNICNRGLLAKGVQLELSRGIRDTPAIWSHLSGAVNTVLTSFETI